MAMEKASSPGKPAISQMARVMRAMTMTMGTKTPETLSARRATGALEEEASSIRWIIWARVVSSPVLVASKSRVPVPLMVAEVTGSPGAFSTGILSPVMADSSMEL